jgi:hypothetical protein
MQSLNENLFQKIETEKLNKIVGGLAGKTCTSWSIICGGPHNGESIPDGTEID